MGLVVITKITLKKVMQILEGSMSFVDRYNLIMEIFLDGGGDMYNSWLLYEWSKERHGELLKEAEMEHLIRKNQSKSKRSFSGLLFLLNNLRKIMVT